MAHLFIDQLDCNRTQDSYTCIKNTGRKRIVEAFQSGRITKDICKYEKLLIL